MSRQTRHDKIHKVDINLEQNWESFFSNWFPLQRLRGLMQLGLAKRIYGAKHSRYDHSFGVVGAVRRLISEAKGRNAYWVDQIHIPTLEIMALIHDIGHGPYSHVAEMILKRNPKWRPGELDSHEDFTELLIGDPDKWKNLCSDLYSDKVSGINIQNDTIESVLERLTNIKNDIISNISHDVLEFMSFLGKEHIVKYEMPLYQLFGKQDNGLGKSPEYSLISGDFDFDRFDYILRDGYETRLVSGNIVEKIWESFSDNLIPTSFQYKLPSGNNHMQNGFAFNEEILDMFELFLVARHYHFQQIAYHPITRLAECLWIHATESKLKKLNNDFERKKLLLKWFTRFQDGDLDEEIRDFEQTVHCNRLPETNYINLVNWNENVKDWRIVSVPFWHLIPQERIKILDMLSYKDNEQPSEIVKLEYKILENLKLEQHIENAKVFVDFVIPPIDVYNTIVKVRNVDYIPYTFMRNRSASLTVRNLDPFKDGYIVLYIHKDINLDCDRHTLWDSLRSALSLSSKIAETGRLSRLALSLETVLTNNKDMTAVELSGIESISQNYTPKANLIGTKEAEAGSPKAMLTRIKETESSRTDESNVGLNHDLEKDLEKLHLSGFLVKSIASYHPDDEVTVWGNLLIKYSLNTSSSDLKELFIDNFLHSILHSLRESICYMSQIRAFLNTDKMNFQEVKSSISAVLEHIERSEILGQELLTLRKKCEFMPIPVRLYQFLYECRNAVRDLGIRNGVTTVIDDRLRDIPIINIDPKAFKIVAINLLSNAIKYANQNSEVRISGSFDDNRVIINFGNIGIPICDRQKIFLADYREPEAMRIDPHGTGIGLAIVKKITEQCNWGIDANSRQTNRGYLTEFRLFIPR